MKRTFLAISVLSLLLASCGKSDRTVCVSNPSEVDRTDETVEVPFSALGIRGLSSLNAVVRSAEGAEIPSQTVSDSEGALSLIFQTSVKAGESASFTVSKGTPAAYDTLAWSRYVPERKDDYAYENNIVVGRIYGPALEGPRTFGPDVWIKNTPRFVFDDWLAIRDFHRNHGEGCDCYMVGKALGGGACAPVAGGKVCVGDNWATQKRLSNGPLRTEAEFTYAVFPVGESSATARRSLSLDANTRLVRWTTSFEAEGVDSLEVIVGAVVHDTVSFEFGEDYVYFTEWASDSKLEDPHEDGLISIGVVLADRFKGTPAIIDGHAGFILKVAGGETVEFWTASGWNGVGVESPEEWNAYMKAQAYAVNHPLTVEVVK